MSMRFQVGLDMGSSNTRIMSTGSGSIISEATLFQVNEKGMLELVGDAAYRTLGRTHDKLRAVWPVLRGAVENMALCVELINYLTPNLSDCSANKKYTFLVASPTGVRESDRRALTTAVLESMGSQCYLVESSIAAALGAGIELSSPETMVVAELGAGIMAASLLAGGHIIKQVQLPYGSANIDVSIQRKLAAQGIRIGLRTAQELKHTLGAAWGGRTALKENVLGLDQKSGFPVVREVTAELVNQAIEPVVQQLCILVNDLLQSLSGQMASDVSRTGIVLTGGGANLFGIERLLADATGLACRVADDPEGCTAHGLELLLARPALAAEYACLGRSLNNDKRF